MSHSSFLANIKGFLGPNALVHIPDHSHEFAIPTQTLPVGIKEGDNITFKVLTPEAQKNEYHNIASAALEMLLNG